MFASRVPDIEHRAIRRTDVFYEIAWKQPDPKEKKPALVRRDPMMRSCLELPKHERGDSMDVAFGQVIADGRFERLAAIGDWRRLTAEQLGSLLGAAEVQSLPSRNGRRWSEMPLWLRSAFDAGLLKRSTWRGQRVLLQADSAVAHELQKRLSPTALDKVTSGTGKWNSPGGGDRHDICTTEALLRFGEHAPNVVAVLAESAAKFNALAGSEIVERSRSGDGLISRSDGRHVVLETTATAGDIAKLRVKVETSVTLLKKEPSLAVLFLEAAHPDSSPSKVWTKLRDLVGEVVAALPVEDAAAIEGRLAIARWSWYWPRPHEATIWANTLGAYYPTRDPSEPWGQVHFLDLSQPDFSLARTDWGHELLHRSLFSSSNPYWLRHT